jgi:hypothetical protein
VSAYERYFTRPAGEPARKPLAELTRAQLAARVQALRQTLDLLWSCSDIDGGEALSCIGRVKVCLIETEGALRRLDQAERGEPLPLEVALAMVSREAV